MYCAGCHGPSSSAKGGFNTVLDVSALLAAGKVVPKQPELSLIWKRMFAGSMPPVDVVKRPADADVSAIKDWISCGAADWDDPVPPSVSFVTIDARVRVVFDDLRAIPNPVDRERQRYLDLSPLSNAGASAQQLQVYREAVTFLLNSLSRGRGVIAPEAIDEDALIYRIDLRDYLWDATTWNQLEASYPYAVVYDQDSRLFPFDEVTAEQIRAETNTEIPLIQADWFLSHASRPPLYNTLLDLPATLPQLEQQLGVDIQRDIDSEQVLRAGFANAVPSQNNRVIERHELGGNRGALWVSYDFASNLDARNIFANPIDFREDSTAIIFSLDNGLQGYYLANATGQRLDKASNVVLQDRASRDGAVENGLSCMGCHQQEGALPKYDEIREFQLQAGASAQEIESVLALYGTRDELKSAFDADQARYRSALAALDITQLENETLHTLDDAHLGILDIGGVASVVGITQRELQRAIDASPQAFPPEIVTMRANGGSIQRDSFDAVVGDLVEALGLGRQLRARNDASNAAMNASPPARSNQPQPQQPQPQQQPQQPEPPKPQKQEQQGAAAQDQAQGQQQGAAPQEQKQEAAPQDQAQGQQGAAPQDQAQGQQGAASQDQAQEQQGGAAPQDQAQDQKQASPPYEQAQQQGSASQGT